MDRFSQIAIVFISVLAAVSSTGGPFDWVGRDNYDYLDSRISKVNQRNCGVKTRSELLLPPESVSMLPRSNQLLDVSTRVFKNRTCLLALHNLALAQSYFHSYIFKLTNDTEDFWKQPALFYNNFRHSGFVSAFIGCVNGSSLIFDYNMTYPDWLTSVSFNNTIPFFGVSASRNQGKVKYPFSQKGPSMNKFIIRDRGAGPAKNYTKDPMEWYTMYLPDKSTSTDETKGSYSVNVLTSPTLGKWDEAGFQSVSFFGPPPTRIQDNVNLPVKFTQPYFDCGHRQSWVVSAVAPIVDAIPRYRPYKEIVEFGETPSRFVGVAKFDVDWEQIDFNPCDVGDGNPGPSMLAGTHRCKTTTMCQPLTGLGFKRGSYECVCRPGYRYPYWQEGPYQGSDIESATAEEYERGFDCIGIDNMRVVPSVLNRQAPSSGLDTVQSDSGTILQDQQISVGKRAAENAAVSIRPRYRKSFQRHRRQTTDNEAVSRMQSILNHIRTVQETADCKSLPPTDLVLPGDVLYGAKEQFQYQARTALAMSHFLSGMLQNVDPLDIFGSVTSDVFPNPDLLHGEALSHVMADHKILGFGIWFDEDKYLEPTGARGRQTTRRRYFAPYAFKKNGQYSSVDMAGDADVGGYTRSDWFRKLKMRWATSTAGVKAFKAAMFYRLDAEGSMSVKHRNHPIVIRAVPYEHGHWSEPHFACNGFVDDWVVTYSVPFFDKDIFDSNKLVFIGAVTVDIKLDYLDINQCSGEFYTPNAFKDTARCDYASTYCRPVEGRKFTLGNYRCHCKRGYEYPFIEDAWFFDGGQLETEWEKKQRGEFNKFDAMKCRPAAAGSLRCDVIVVLSLMLLSLLVKH